MALLRLPDELLHSIFRDLVPASDMNAACMVSKSRGALAALCRTNKQCLSIARPLLYHTIVLEPLWHPRGKHVLSLAAKFAQCPQLAGNVHMLRIEGWEDDQDSDGTHSTGLPSTPSEASTFKYFETATEMMHPVLGHHAARLLEAIQQQRQDAVVAFLLALCQDLETLEIVVPFDFEESYVHSLLHHFADVGSSESIGKSAQSARGLPRLRELRVRHWDTEGAVGIYRIAEIMGKSSLDVFRGDMINITNLDLGPGFYVRPWSLRCIVLTNSLVDSSGVTELLQCCPELESLSIEWGSATVGADYDIFLNEFGEAFRKYGQNLQSIDLDVRRSFRMDHEDNTNTHPIASLTALTRLTRLAVPQLALMKLRDDASDEEGFELPVLADILPPSLRTLSIYKCNRRYENQKLDDLLLDLISSKRFHRMRTIRIERPREFSQKDALPKMGWTCAEDDQYWIELWRTQSTDP
nr:hypothetical protein CFP56_34767 [Quercus suber]